jgi:hypothetical protein
MTESDVSRETTPAIGAHYCAACGHMHGAEGQDSAVKIAEINAKRDIRLAELARSETRTAAELGAETEVAVAEIHAGAGVAEAEALAEGIADSGDGAEVPVIADVPAPDAEPEVTDTIAPRDEEEDTPPLPAAEPRSSLSYWP